MSCIIGITCTWKEAENRNYLSHDYVRSIQDAGGVPLLIPVLDPRQAAAVYEACDGLVLSGGHDVDPILFGEEPLRGLGEVTPARDNLEIALSHLALKGTKPLLAICRGIQVLNIAAGGSVYQDIKGVSDQLHDVSAPRWYPVHQVEIEQNSKLARILQNTSIRVNSYHHQSVKNVGEGLVAVGWSKDGMIEALENIDGERAILGVQWHPEGLSDRDDNSSRLFKNLVEEALRRKG